MTLAIYQIDAFAEAVFQGNPAAVVPLESWLPDDILQAIAAENNLSETAYFIPIEGGYHLRWFTPTTEVRLCGHATLASAHVLFEHLGFAGDEIRFQALAGELRVRKEAGRLTLDFPADPPSPAALSADAFERALGTAVLDVQRAHDDVLVRISSQTELQAITPARDFILQLEDARGLIVTAPGDATDIASRCFYPAYGVEEDPVTGSAHTVLTPYWTAVLGKDSITAMQGGARTGYLQCRMLGDRVAITGKAQTYLHGQIHLPGQ